MCHCFDAIPQGEESEVISHICGLEVMKMRLSTKARYGVRALCALAILGREGEPVPLSRIADHECITRQYLALIFHLLSHAGYVQARRGLKGGYVLAKDPSEITVGDIVRTLDGSTAPIGCVGEGEGEGKPCRRMDICPTRPAWQRLTQAIDTALDSVTISSLVMELSES